MKTSVYTLLVLCTMACTKTEKADCPSDLACTQEYMSLSVKVLNNKGEDVKLSKTTAEIAGNTNIITKTNFEPFFNYYVILDDASLKDVSKSGSTVTFKGYYANNQLHFSEKYVIGHDCCHIVKMEGKDVIIIN